MRGTINFYNANFAVLAKDWKSRAKNDYSELTAETLRVATLRQAWLKKAAKYARYL